LPGRREGKKSLTRQRLIEAASAVFVELGYSAATLDVIADRAGLTKGAVYSNFESKADLALAVIDSRVDRPHLEILDLVDVDASFNDQLERGTKLLVEALDAMEPWFAVELEYTAHALRNPGMLELLRARDESLREVAMASIGDRLSPSNKTVDPGLFAIALAAVSNGFALERLKNRDVVPDWLLIRLIAAVHWALADASEPSADRKRAKSRTSQRC
jgi:AcrR family transcriptional regulator